MKRTPLARRSPRREVERAERFIVVQRVLARDRNTCQAAGLVVDVACRGQLDVHERIQRSLYPGGHLDVDNCVTVCRAHHNWIDGHIAQAHALGLLRHSWDSTG